MTKAELYQKACMLPLLPGVYIIRDKSDTIIYIGKAKRLRIRVSQYFREGVPHDNKVSQMIAHAYAFDVIVCQSEFEALVLEASQIKAHTPKYNILLKDDKGYSYIKVTKDEWPRLSFTLQKEDDGAEYIGPYTSSFAARQMAETAMDAFLLPRCNRRFPQEIGRGRPCLNAHIGKCMAVCSGKISCENYNEAVKSAVHLIRYGKKDILKLLSERMQEASDRLEFETAALIRDQIAAITKVTAGQKVVGDPDVEMDVVALADVPLYGMVKDDHHRTRAIVDSEGREIAINMNRGTFTFITAIQDETHRFANAYRRQQMNKKSYSSTLTEVPGVGPKTAKALMAQFKSVGAVKEATPDQLENTPGVGRQMAQTIYEYFHPQG